MKIKDVAIWRGSDKVSIDGENHLKSENLLVKVAESREVNW